MTLLLSAFFTLVVAFVFSHHPAKQYAFSSLKSLIITLQRRYQSSEKSRIAKATRALEPLKVELLDRYETHGLRSCNTYSLQLTCE